MPTDQQMQRRDLVSRTLCLRADTIDEEARSVEAVLTTGRRALVYDWSTLRLIEEELVISGAKLPDQVPMLESHMRWSLDTLVGSGRELRIEGQQIVARLFFTDGDDQADKDWNKVRQGHLTDVSIGYRVWAFTDIKPYTNQVVNGTKYMAGDRTLRITTKWALKEVSLVPIGADEAAKIRQDMGLVPEMEKTDMNKQLRDYLETLGLRKDATDEGALNFYKLLDGEQWKRADELKETVAGFKPTGSAPVTVTGQFTETLLAPVRRATNESKELNDAQQITEAATVAATAAVTAERKRAASIRELGGGDVPTELVTRAVNEGWSEDKASGEFLKAIRDLRQPAVGGNGRAQRTGEASITVGEDRSKLFNRAMADALLLGFGIEPDGESAQREAQQFDGIGLQDAARLTLRNEHTDAGFGQDALYSRAISTGSFAEILGDAATKRLHRAYQDFPATASLWAGTRDVPDFKTYKDLKLGAFGSIPQIGNAGEIEHGTIAESKETYAALTYGRQWALTRQMWINDDLGAFLRIPGELGAAARRNIDDVVYTLLISASGVGPTMNEDSTPLFDTGRTTPNYKTGATAGALSDAGLANVKALCRKMTGLASEHINILARVLLMPPELEHAGLKLIRSSELMVASSATSGSQTEVIMGTANVHRGTLTPVVEPRLSAATNGTTAWYLVADPIQAESIVIVYLRGQRNPVVERKDPVDVLGLGWRMYHDVGAAALDWRGIFRGKGA